MNLQADITDILIKSLRQKLSAGEQEILDAWLAHSEANVHLFERLNNKKIIASELDKLYRIDQNRENAWQKLCQTLELDAVPSSSVAPIAHPNRGEMPRSAHRIHFLKTSWFRYAAAVILIAGGAAIWWEISRSARNDEAVVTTVPKNQDIQPGSNKAVLTLADGSQIVLDHAANGNLAQQGNTRVIKLDNGQLAYNAGKDLNKEVFYNTISTPRGGQYQIVLPDGSKVWMNAASSIKFPAAFSGTERNVIISGEVYMEIAQRSKQPFIVKANGTEIRVLGTSFNVNAYTDEEAIKTTLVEGSVKVTKGSSAALLHPGQEAITEDNSNSVKVNDNADVANALAWKNGLFSFNNADIKTIMRQLSRWYNVDVVYEGAVTDRRFLGELRRNMTLAAVLRVLERSGVHFTIEGKKLIVKP